MGNQAARVTDKVAHPVPGVLTPGTGSTNVITGSLPSWRGLPASAGMALQAAKKISDAVIDKLEKATVLAAGTPGAPAAIAAEKLGKTLATTAMTTLMNGLAAASAALCGGMPDTHLCLTPPLPPPPHGPGMVFDGSPTVLVNGLPFCAVGDHVLECLGPPDPIVQGCATVLVGKAGGGGGGGLGDLLGAIIAAAVAAVSAVRNVVDSVVDFLAAVVAEVLAQIAKLVDKINKAVQAAIDKVLKALVDAFKKAAEAIKKAVTPEKVIGNGDKVDDLIAKSPTLTSNLDKLKKDGWTVKYGEPGKGSFTDKGKKEIVIDPNKKGNPDSVVRSLSHESGHALYTQDPHVPPDGLTKDDFVKKNTNSDLKDEGEATMTNAQIRQEIVDNGGDDVGISGAQPDKYAEIAKKYPDPADRDKARQEIADAYAEGEHPSTDPGKTYREYYSEQYEKEYDEANKK